VSADEPPMWDAGSGSDYEILDPEGLRAFLAELPETRHLLGPDPREWQVREVGDGNLNVVFLVDGPDGSLCVKQALPYVRVAGPSWPMTPERAYFEQAYYRAVAPFVGARVPRLHHYDAERHCIVMERLAPHMILRHGLIAGRRYPRLARDIGEYIARACFFTSDLAQPFERKMEGLALFARNTPLLRITVDLVFTDPYCERPRNRHTSPQLDALVADLRRDGALKAAAAACGRKFLDRPQALVHGDLHSGSVMVTEHDTRVIDPEFAFYGPIGFDLGAFFGNLLLSWYAQPGHASREGERDTYREWILDQVSTFWESFRASFLALWEAHGRGDAYPAAMFAHPADAPVLQAARIACVESLFADMLGFGACKMIRRIVGFAHVLDFDSIADADLRARCESGALAMARLLLTQPERFRSIGDVAEAVPRMDATPKA
jgi:5-methylthioribose kinase